MLRLFLDSNVLVSGLVHGGLPRELPRAGVAQAYTPVVSGTVVDEVDRTLAAKFGVPLGPVGLALGLLGPELVADTDTSSAAGTPVLIRDPNDAPIVAAALAAGVDALVTGDKDVLCASGLPVRVLRTREALELLRDSGTPGEPGR